MTVTIFKPYNKVDISKFNSKFGELFVEPHSNGYTTPCGRFWIHKVNKTPRWVIEQGPQPNNKDFLTVENAPNFRRLSDALQWLGNYAHE